MSEIIDYAGLFPPADLPMGQAFRNYLDYTRSEYAWMLSAFVIPAARLSELEDFYEKMEEHQPLTFSVLGSQTETVNDYLRELTMWFNRINKFNDMFGPMVETPCMELKLPKEVAGNGKKSEIKDLIEATFDKVAQERQLPHQLFIEAPIDHNWQEAAAALIDVIADINILKGASNSEDQVCFKLRTGGVEPWMVPSIEQVGWALTYTRQLGVALKCTAGLHHPLRAYDRNVGTTMHGFFNVFGAALLAYANDLKGNELIEILSEEEPAAFSFDEEGMMWRADSRVY